MHRTAFSVTVLLSFATCATAQVAQLRASWANTATSLVEAAMRFPEADYSFRPTPQVRSFAQLIGHIADAHYTFCSPLAPPLPKRTGLDKLTAKSELVSALKESVDYCSSAGNQFSDANSNTMVKLFGQEKTRLTVLWQNLAHSNEHYGNIVTYLRLKGITPPTSDPLKARALVYFDLRHGQWGPRAGWIDVGAHAGFRMIVETLPLSPGLLKAFQVLCLRVPVTAFTDDERAAVVSFVKGGGSLLLVVDEERFAGTANGRGYSTDLVSTTGGDKVRAWGWMTRRVSAS